MSDMSLFLSHSKVSMPKSYPLRLTIPLGLFWVSALTGSLQPKNTKISYLKTSEPQFFLQDNSSSNPKCSKRRWRWVSTLTISRLIICGNQRMAIIFVGMLRSLCRQSARTCLPIDIYIILSSRIACSLYVLTKSDMLLNLK